MLEICLWNPDEQGRIRRSDRIPDTIPNISRFQQVVLHQGYKLLVLTESSLANIIGRIERFFLDSLKKHSDIRVERGVLPQSMEIDSSKPEDLDAYPITLTLQHLTEEEANPTQSKATNGTNGAKSDGLFRSNMAPDDTDELLQAASSNPLAGSLETVKAKYLIGCDGAHSWVRRQLGPSFALEGEQTDYIWGVLDIIPLTDFPDIRMRCAIHSASSGSVMVIPRENKLVRLYIQMTTTDRGTGNKLDRSNITPQLILESAQKTLAPYKLTYEYCDWWTAYQIGQRVGSSFSKDDRVFLAGDAVHTHSPKAGQGMNVSMQDTYNLGWKIAGVLNGTLDRKVLKTYESERRKIAQDLIEFDHKFSRLFSGRPAKDVADEAGISMSEFKEAFVKGNLFASGVAVDYGGSVLVAKSECVRTDLMSDMDKNLNGQFDQDQNQKQDVDREKEQHLKWKGAVKTKQEVATNVKIGMRFPSFQVLNQADARPIPFQSLLKSDSRFRIILFAANSTIPAQKSRIENLCSLLTPLIQKYTPSSKPIDSVIEILTLHSAPRDKVEIFDFPELLRPWSKEGWDYWKIFVDAPSYHEGDGKAYEGYGVDKEGEGALVVVRPDGYVGWVGGIEGEDVREVERYFGGFMRSVEE